jgi:uncharacterized membrane protein YraQ (UPF0718 family)
LKETLIILVLMLLALGGAALWKGPDTFSLGARTAIQQLIQYLPVLAVAVLLAGFTEALLPAELVKQWLSDESGWRGIGLAWLAGILTPGGTLTGMPLAAVLFKAGAGIGVLVTYLTSLAVLSVLRIPLEVGFYGWRLTALRAVASLLLPPIAGLLAQVLASLNRA